MITGREAKQIPDLWELDKWDQLNVTLFGADNMTRVRCRNIHLNIARGTTDPEIDSITWIKLGNNMAPLTIVANLATRSRHLH